MSVVENKRCLLKEIAAGRKSLKALLAVQRAAAVVIPYSEADDELQFVYRSIKHQILGGKGAESMTAKQVKDWRELFGETPDPTAADLARIDTETKQLRRYVLERSSGGLTLQDEKTNC